MTYPGGKGKCFQHIINLFPPHTTYIETHLGGGAVLRNKKPAVHSVGIDKDARVISFWRRRYPRLAEYINTDALNFLRIYPFVGSELIYCDPPYLPSTRKRARVYRCDLTEADHSALLDTLVQLPCRVVISGYSSELYHSRLKSWNTFRFLVKTHTCVREECVWTNYPAPNRLHEMSYFGMTYRDRQNHKRRIDRLRNRIARLKKPEQYELIEWLSNHLGTGGTENATVRLPQGN